VNLTDLTALFSLSGPALLVFARVSALFVSGPIIGGPYAPLQVRALLAVAVTGVILGAKGQVAVPTDGTFLVLLVKEAMVGLTLGFFLNLFISGIRFGGDLANRHAGFSAAENFDPETESTVSPIGDLFHIGAMLLFLISDGHHYFFAAMSRSYDIVPLGELTFTAGLSAAMVSGVNDMCVIALAMSFPVLAAVMAITVAEGVIVRAVPQINMLHFSFAVKILVSLMMLYAGMPTAVAFMGVVLAAMQQAGYALLGLMS
jgi:flagellar biosynthesis protein FliR